MSGSSADKYANKIDISFGFHDINTGFNDRRYPRRKAWNIIATLPGRRIVPETLLNPRSTSMSTIIRSQSVNTFDNFYARACV